MKEQEAISGIFMNEEGNKVLLLKRAPWRTCSARKWDLMGGDIAVGEKPLATLKRDAKGKLNLDIDSFKVEEKRRILTKTPDGVIIKRYCFVCQGDYGNLRIETEKYRSKYTNMGWFNKKEIKELDLAPGVELILDTLKLLK